MEDPPPQRWDRGKWITVFSSHSPTIREITECLGLSRAPSASTTNRGIPKFDAPESKKLSSEVQRLSKDLPKDRDALLDFAADPTSLDKELNDLLATLGPAIWGKDADRHRLLVAPDPTKKTYYKDLYYDDPEDRTILKIHLHRWIIIKACYYIRNMKLKRPSTADEYETVADIDIDSPDKSKLLSPSQTPRSCTPVVAESDAGGPHQANPLKRKSEIYRSMSDGEDYAGPDSGFGPRKRSFESATLPLQRKSPRKSIISTRFSSENIPPSSSSIHHLQLQPAVKPETPAPDTGRLLSPLSNNALNGTSRPSNPTPPTAFTAVNNNTPAAGFTAVNGPNTTSPPTVHSAHPGQPTKLVQSIPSMQPLQSTQHTTTAPTIQTAPAPNSYASPYSAPTASNPPAPTVPAETIKEESRPPAAPMLPRETSRHSTPSVHAPQSQTPPIVHTSITATVAPLAPAPPSTQPAFHSHGIPASVHGPPPSRTPPVPHIPVINGAMRAAPILPSNGVHPPHPNGYTVPIQHGSVSSRLPSVKDTTLLQCELLGLLMRYFFPRNGPQCDEGELLYNLEYVWAQNEPVFARVMGRLFEYQRRVLFAWVDERRKISQLQNTMVGQPIVHAPEMVDRLLAMNDLRVMRLKWKAMKTHDGSHSLSPEDLLCKTLATMTKTEGTEHLFKDGLERLNESVFGFLKSEDMKISMHMKQQAE